MRGLISLLGWVSGGFIALLLVIGAICGDGDGGSDSCDSYGSGSCAYGGCM